jgi:hypothetical protein
MPGTKANAAAMNLLISSTPGEYHADITCFPSAYEAMLWICSKFRGGHNPAINNEWLRRFQQEGMTKTETLEQYVQRKVRLFRSLLANGHSMAAGDLSKYIIEGLPVEFATGKCSMYSPFAAASPEGTPYPPSTTRTWHWLQ